MIAISIASLGIVTIAMASEEEGNACVEEKKAMREEKKAERFSQIDTDGDGEISEEERNAFMEEKKAMVKNFSRNYTDLHARYVKLIAKNPGPCPDWHPGAGSPSWVFVDEIVIE